VKLRQVLAAAFLAIGAASQAAKTDDGGANLNSPLTAHFAFTAADFAELQRGRVIKRSMDARTPGEIGVVGAVRVHATKSSFINRVRDIERFKRGPDVLQIGTFSNPPVASDLNRLTIGPEDFDARNCHLHDCNIRIPADLIAQVEQEVGDGSGDAQGRGAKVFKQGLLDHVRAYLAGGAGRMTQYDDTRAMIRPMDQFAGVLENSPVLRTLVPGMPEHLSDPATAPLDGAIDFVYWSKEKFGLAPFVTVTHTSIVCPSESMCVIASRDVYSSRYFDTSLALTVAADVPSENGSFDLLYANRARANALKGTFAALKRSIVERRAKAWLDDTLRKLRQILERTG
jgi:hypothetical protein